MRVNIPALAIAGIILISLFLAVNYQPSYVAPSNFFGSYVGTVVLFGAHLEHEHAGLGLAIGMLISVLTLYHYRLGLKIIVPQLSVVVVATVLVLSDLQGLVVPLTTGRLVSVAIGLIYAGLIHLLFVGMVRWVA